MMDPDPAEQFVVKELKPYELRCERFSKSELRKRKTPDRRVYRGDEFAFFLEVKEITEALKHGLGDSILDRIANDIHEAIKQFDSVNPQCEHPNVLAFVNRNRACSVLDVEEVFLGHRRYDTGLQPTGLRWSEGRTRDEKDRVHLFLWFDAFAEHESQLRFNFRDKRHLSRLAAYFAIDPDTIPDIAAWQGTATDTEQRTP